MTSGDASVLVLTCVDDRDADAVVTELHGRGVPVVRFDPGVDYPDLVMAVHIGSGGYQGWLRTPTRHLDITDVRSVYYRRPSAYTEPPGLSGQGGRFAAMQARWGLDGLLGDLRCRYVSHPDAIAAAEQKPAGLHAAHTVGFNVPATLITTDADAARAFAAGHGPVIYKPLRSPGLSDRDGKPLAVWAQEADPATFDDSIGLCPHLFQALVPKACDMRTTVIGDRAFSARLDSPNLDYRSDYAKVTYNAAGTPDEIIRCCVRYLCHFGIAFGAFDFAVDETGIWHFLECNPNGQWAWIQEKTGLPIAEAIADELARQ